MQEVVTWSGSTITNSITTRSAVNTHYTSSIRIYPTNNVIMFAHLGWVHGDFDCIIVIAIVH